VFLLCGAHRTLPQWATMIMAQNAVLAKSVTDSMQLMLAAITEAKKAPGGSPPLQSPPQQSQQQPQQSQQSQQSQQQPQPSYQLPATMLPTTVPASQAVLASDHRLQNIEAQLAALAKTFAAQNQVWRRHRARLAGFYLACLCSSPVTYRACCFLRQDRARWSQLDGIRQHQHQTGLSGLMCEYHTVYVVPTSRHVRWRPLLSWASCLALPIRTADDNDSGRLQSVYIGVTRVIA